VTKVLFIGRIYAASIERRKNKDKLDMNNDNFYIKKVAPTFRNSKLDLHLAELKDRQLSTDYLQRILQVHFELMKTLYKITELEKRSFCSKYLHFHLPDLFFIYDSRAVTALREFTSRVPTYLQHILQRKNIDREYAKFFCKCFDLKNKIELYRKTTLTPRVLDNIETANNKK
jgi:hypothetical protein